MSAAHGGCPRVDVQLGEDALGVSTQRVERDVELPGDLWPGQVAVEQPEHLQLALAQRVCQELLCNGRLGGWPRAPEESPGLSLDPLRVLPPGGRVVAGVGGVVQEVQHRSSLVQVEADVAVRLRRLDEGLGQCGQRPWYVAVGMM